MIEKEMFKYMPWIKLLPVYWHEKYIIIFLLVPFSELLFRFLHKNIKNISKKKEIKIR
jgi:hypothetical protein